MNSTAVKDFFDWYKSWYKPIAGEMNIMFSVPNELHLQEFRMLMVEENVVVLELFEKIDQGIDAKVYMRQICDKADELGVTIYLEPMPRYKYFRKNIEKRKKVSKEYLFAYYAGFGFEPTSDNRFMKRTPKMNDRKEFYTRTYADGTEQRFSIEDYEKNVLPTLGEGGKFHLGGDMSVHLAPNGKPSNLTHEQWHLVRTPEFKNWFGDWEEAYHTGDYEGVSKVIDENGDPLVCYHGSNAEFNVFELFKGTFRSGKINSFGHYFTDRLRASYYGKIVKGYFLNARNPKFLNSFQDYYRWVRYDLGVSDKKTIREIDFDVNGKIAKIIVKNKFDGLVVKAPLPKHRYSLNDPYNKETDVNYIVYKPTQIKLADGTNTTFDGRNPDIRYAKGGGIENEVTPENYFDSTEAHFTGIEPKDALQIMREYLAYRRLKNKPEFIVSEKYGRLKVDYASIKKSAFFQSRSFSFYFIGEHDDFLIRISDHWSKSNYDKSRKLNCGRIASCYWDNYGERFSLKLPAERFSSELIGGICYFKDFEKIDYKELGGIYHGSPHKFEKFSTEFMGSGEGAQAFGWGLYFTDLKSIGETYAKVLAEAKSNASSIAQYVYGIDYTKEQVYALMKMPVENQIDLVNNAYNEKIEQINKKPDGDFKIHLLETQNNLRKRYIEGAKQVTPYLYHVTLHKGKTPDQYTWLEWDEYPLSENVKSKIITAILKENPQETPFKNRTDLINEVKNAKNTSILYSILSMYALSRKEASLFLLRAGFDGIKYPAESKSRGATSDTARGFNYVVFDPNAVTIEEVQQFAKGGEIDYSNYETAIVVLLNKENEILVLQRGSTAPWMPNKWSLVGGVVDAGENIEEAAKREVLEEVGITITDIAYLKETYSKDVGRLVYFVASLPKDYEIKMDYENQAYKFVSPETYRELEYVPDLAAFIGDFFRMNLHKSDKFAKGKRFAGGGKVDANTELARKLAEAEIAKIECLECDGATRILHYVFTKNGVEHKVMQGSVKINSYQNIPFHLWIELPDGNVVDYKSRMWMGEGVSEGVFKPKKGTYKGYEIGLNVNEALYNILTMAKGGKTDELLAPNGKPSNLTHEQWHLVRTPEFKAWFGDWENDPENASKVVDENGEPMVVYHFTDIDFNIFELKGTSIGFFFVEDKYDDEFSAEGVIKSLDKGINPRWLQKYNVTEEQVREGLKKSKYKVSKTYFLSIKKLNKSVVPDIYWSTPAFENPRILKSKYDKYDGIEFVNEVDEKRIIVAFEPTQIKLADGTNTTFDGRNPDIRFAEGGEFDDGSENFGKPPVEYSEIPFIHETRKDVAQKILKSGFIVGTNPAITKGIYTIPIVWKNEKFDKTANTQELAVWLKDGIKIFWTNSERPTDYYLGYGNKFYQNLYRRLNKGYKSPKEDWSNKEYQEGFSRRMENWLKDNGYVGVQQGGEIVITDLKAIDYVEVFNRHEESKPDIKYAKGGVFPSLITSYSQLGW